MHCDACGRPFEARRRDHRFCSGPCRVRGFAKEKLTTLYALRDAVAAEVARWEAARDGRRRRGRGQKDPLDV